MCISARSSAVYIVYLPHAFLCFFAGGEGSLSSVNLLSMTLLYSALPSPESSAVGICDGGGTAVGGCSTPLLDVAGDTR